MNVSHLRDYESRLRQEASEIKDAHERFRLVREADAIGYFIDMLRKAQRCKPHNLPRHVAEAVEIVFGEAG